MTQKEIAEYLSCERTTYSKYECGKRDMPLRVVVMLADLYETSVDYLFGRVKNRGPYPKSRRK